MSDRRMLSKKVTDDDLFVGLSAEAQILYVHLNMATDDDGFCGQSSLCMFKAHASKEHLQELIDANLIYKFDDGAIVIRHWLTANTIRSNRKKDTTFTKDLEMLELVNGVYVLTDKCQTSGGQMSDKCQTNDGQMTDKCQTNDGQMTDKCQTNDGQMSAQYNIKELNITKEKVLPNGNTKEKAEPDGSLLPFEPSEEDLREFEEMRKSKKKKDPKVAHGEYENVFLTEDEYNKLINKYGFKETEEAIDYLGQYIHGYGKEKKYKCHYDVLINWVYAAVAEKKGVPPAKAANNNRYAGIEEWLRQSSG